MSTLSPADRDRLDAQLKALRVVCPCQESGGTGIWPSATDDCSTCAGTGTVARFLNGLESMDGVEWVYPQDQPGGWLGERTITTLQALTIYETVLELGKWSKDFTPKYYWSTRPGEGRSWEYQFATDDAATLVQRIGERISREEVE